MGRLVYFPSSRVSKGGGARPLYCSGVRFGVCVCVSTPVPKGSTFCFLNAFSAGALSTPWQTQCNEAMPWSGKHGLITRVYLQKLWYKLSNPPFLIPWWFMILPKNHFPSATFSCCAFRELQTSEQFVKVSLTFLLDLGTELTENQCQSVCVCVCSGQTSLLFRCDVDV